MSWNGSGFDLPVLNYRALLAGVQAPRYWETGDGDTAFRYNNYLSRYHWRHTDLMDVLSGFQGRGTRLAREHGPPARPAGQARVLGRAGVGCVAGGQSRRHPRSYCETDVLNTYLIYLRFELMRGRLTRERYAEEVERVKALLRAPASSRTSREFLRAWEAAV